MNAHRINRPVMAASFLAVGALLSACGSDPAPVATTTERTTTTTTAPALDVPPAASTTTTTHTVTQTPQ